jgi:PKD repeat protein
MQRSIGLLTICLFSIGILSAQIRPVIFENKTIEPESITPDFSIIYNHDELQEGKVFRLLQFGDIPSAEVRHQLLSEGVELINYYPHQTYLAAIPPSITPSTLMEAGVIGQATLPWEAKVSSEIYRGDIGDWALEGSKAHVVVRYFDNLSKENVSTTLEKNGIRVKAVFPDYHIIKAVVDINRIYDLAEMSVVQHVNIESAPGEPEDVEGRTLHRSNRINTKLNGGLNYNGEGVAVLTRDDGVVGPHIDYHGRLDNLETYGFIGIDHADGVSGIFAGAGNLDPRMEGMASAADLYVVNYQADFLDNTLDLHHEQDVMVTNSSYSNGCNAGYTDITETVDQQLETNKTFLHVFSAGNSGTLNCNYGAGNRWGNITGGHKIAKNVIATANLRIDMSLENSSSRGPASDGRLKPDISARGTDQFSTDPDNGYSAFGGTSAASPGIAGIAAQLYHAYRDLNNGEDPESALIKAAMLNTANDLGNEGPDFLFGWGHVNAYRAYKVLEEQRFLKDNIAHKEVNNHELVVEDGLEELRVMLYWREQAASPGAGVALINDLDLTLEDEQGNIYYPWLLDPTPDPVALATPATNGRDSLNNVEQVLLRQPAAGTYKVVVSGNTVPSGSRDYFLVFETIEDEVTLTYPSGGEGFVPGEEEQIHWDATPGTDQFMLEYSIDNGVNWNDMGVASGSQRVYSWRVPQLISPDCQIRVTRQGVSSKNDISFSIVGTVEGLHVTQVCPSSVRLEWDELDGAEAYDIYMLGERHMEVVASSDTTFAIVQVDDVLAEMWFAIAGTSTDGLKSRRTTAIKHNSGIESCSLDTDLALARLLSPNEHLAYSCGNFDEPVVVELYNNGTTQIGEAIVNYQVDGGSVENETINVDLMPGNSAVYVLSTNLLISTPGSHNIRVWIETMDDQLPGNDEVNREFELRSLATSTSLNYAEDFENAVFPPSGWTLEENVPLKKWQDTRTIGSNGTSTKCMFIENQTGGEIFYEEAIYTQAIDLKGATNPALFFDYAHHLNSDSEYDGNFKVLVYSFCGDRSTVELFNRTGRGFNTSPNNSQFPWAPASSNDWRSLGFDLSEFVGSEIVIGFVVENGFNYNLYLDNINIEESAITFPKADFTISNTKPCAIFEIVEFEVVSSNPDHEYFWFFGDDANPRTLTGAGPHGVRFFSNSEYSILLEVRDSQTSAYASSSKSLTAYTRPGPNFSFQIQNLTVTFENRSNHSLIYEWDFGDGEMSTDQNPVHTYAAPGEYSVVLKASNECTTREKTTKITVGNVDVVDAGKGGIKLFPNPASDRLMVEVEDLTLDAFDYSIKNIEGRSMLSGRFSSSTPQPLNIKQLTSGIYFLSLVSGDKTYVAKFIVE